MRTRTRKQARPRARPDSRAVFDLLKSLFFDLFGGRTRTRTWDPLIKSQLLYQLSYAPGISPPPAVRAGSCSKAGSYCPGKARNAPSCRGFRWLARRPFSGLPPAAREQFGAVAAHIAAVRPFHSRAPGSTKGKPPGGDPAAPVRRRSCRGAGSATAGARLGYMVITGVVRQGVPCPACPCRIGAGPSGAFRRRRVLHGRGTRRGPARPSD